MIVLSDHGEEFLDHGRVTHGTTLYGEQIRVPLIIRPPGGTRDARRLAQVVQLIDVGPTILALTGEPDSRPSQGRSFAQLLGAKAVAPWPDLAFSELFDIIEAQRPQRLHAAAVTSSRWSYLTRPDGGVELYDRQLDRAQTTSLAGAEEAAAAAAARSLARHVAVCEELSKTVHKVSDPLSPEQRERLRALGYIR
ncbi:MAG TPA: sulfatase/phosphatase domain-containing protein [Gemmatimonadota bacterium]|nr:sulfatase/phosphatase domain-containing protein [Gemmatimonadota bacterium]